MGVYLSVPQTNKEIKEGSGNGISFCSAEMQGWRRSMEDAAIHCVDIGNNNALFAVFDGHGGNEVSKYVKSIFTAQFTQSQYYISQDYQKGLDESFRIIDEKIKSQEGLTELQKIRHPNEHKNVHQQIHNGTGCTANVLLITPTDYYIANAGDSRAVLCQEGIAIGLSQDHKPESQVELARIKKAGGSIQMGRVNGGLNLTRSFGDFDYKRNGQLSYEQQMITCKPDLKKMPRNKEKDEFIIMGCDGIWQKYVDNSQGLVNFIKQQIAQKKLMKTIMEEMLDFLIAEDTSQDIGCDNMTAILIALK